MFIQLDGQKHFLLHPNRCRDSLTGSRRHETRIATQGHHGDLSTTVEFNHQFDGI